MRYGFLIISVVTVATLMISLAESPGKDDATLDFVVREETGSVVVEVRGLPITPAVVAETASWVPLQWQSVLAVSVDTAEVSSAVVVPPMIGRYEIKGDHLRFTPPFPTQPGLTYKAHLDPSAWPGGNGNVVTTRYKCPKNTQVPSTTVTRIYPTASALPENLLKFYVHFSAPMSRGRIYDHISLTDADGKVIELPFLEIDEELWDPEMKRITFFIDPGRIKRGVKPLEDIGPSLVEGNHYTFSIATSWRDGQGLPLKEAYQKRFSVVAPDRTPVDPKLWHISAPIANTMGALEIAFNKPMDHAITLRVLRVLNAEQQAVAGDAALGEEERSWSFQPHAAWPKGSFHVVFANTLEDLAGNNVGKAFEVDVFETVETRITSKDIKISFKIK